MQNSKSLLLAVLFTAFSAVFCQGAPVQVGTHLDRVIEQRAATKECTKDAPDTAHGKKACAWFVNSSFEQAYGAPIATGRAYSDVLGTLTAMLSHPKTFQQVSKAGALASGMDYIVITKTGFTPGRGSHIGIGKGQAVYENNSFTRSIDVWSVDSFESHYHGAGFYLILTSRLRIQPVNLEHPLGFAKDVYLGCEKILADDGQHTPPRLLVRAQR
jgi:hypothetical protein